MDALTEVALFVGGLWLVRNLQLPWSKKSVVVVAYGLRLPVIAAAAVRLYYIHQALYADDASLHGVLAAVCTQIELCYAVVATTMPCLKPFMSALNTNYGGVSAFVMTQTPPGSGMQRSRDTAGNTIGHTLGNSAAVMTNRTTKSTSSKARAAAKAAAASVVGMTSVIVSSGGNGSSGTVGGIAGHYDGPKSRQSTESEQHLQKEQKLDLQSDSDSAGVPSPPRTTTTARASKTTSITGGRIPYGDRARLAGVQSPDVVSVTVDITVSEEKDSAPTSPMFAPYHSHGRIGRAE